MGSGQGRLSNGGPAWRGTQHIARQPISGADPDAVKPPKPISLGVIMWDTHRPLGDPTTFELSLD